METPAHSGLISEVLEKVGVFSLETSPYLGVKTWILFLPASLPAQPVEDDIAAGQISSVFATVFVSGGVIQQFHLSSIIRISKKNS